MAETSRLTGSAEAPYTKAKNAALRLLTHRQRAEAEIKRRLEGRFASEVVDRTISDLRRQGLLDDAAFAREWRNSREKFRPRGAGLIRQELQRMGVDREIIQDALSDFDSSANAYQAGSKYAAKLSVEDAAAFRRKLGGFLHRRGFGGEVIGQTIDRIWQELLDPLDSQIDGDGQSD
ncbi:MAG: regulatory protein RecX [Chloroflexi bacterium]|nr:regulatory protein RecX [Chloroflexota bacterium]